MYSCSLLILVSAFKNKSNSLFVSPIVSFNNSYLFNLHFKYNINKYFTIQGNTELFPANFFNRRQSVGKSLGIGVVLRWNSISSLMDVEEDFSELEYDNL